MLADLTSYQRWRYALKPASWPKLFVPATLGQALGIAHLGRIDLYPAMLGMALTFLLLAFVVLLNDWGDREIDALKRKMFPAGCSPKTIPDRILSAGAVLRGGLLAGALAIAFAFFCEHELNRGGIVLATGGALLLFVSYTLPPLKLNYRGGGELLEMLGCGFLLPWINAYMQGGLGAEWLAWLPRPWPVLIGFSFFCMASAVASGLSDEVSDRKGGKRTLTTRLGNAAARRLTELLVVCGAVAWLLTGALAAHVPFWTTLVASAVSVFYLRRMQRHSTGAVTNAFAAQATYKQLLHLAVWRGARALGIALVIDRVFLGLLR